MRLILGAVILCLAFASRAEAARIVVTIDDLHSNKGNVYVALYSKPEGFPDGAYSDQHVKVKATTAPITVVFNHLRSGIYAVGAYHDENGNGRLDTNFLWLSDRRLCVVERRPRYHFPASLRRRRVRLVRG